MDKKKSGLGKTGVMGAFEELVLLALIRQGEQAYAVSIRRELAERSGSDVAMGAVYATLDRLESKGMIAARDGEPGEAGRGRPRRYYDILPVGVEALEQTRSVRRSLWQGIDLEAEAGGR